jgi:hypothetical protein
MRAHSCAPGEPACHLLGAERRFPAPLSIGQCADRRLSGRFSVGAHLMTAAIIGVGVGVVKFSSW